MLDKLLTLTSEHYNLPVEKVYCHLSEAVSEHFSELFQKKVFCTVENGKLSAYFCEQLQDRPIELLVRQSDINSIIKRYSTLLSVSESYARFFQYSNCRRTVIEGISNGEESVYVEGIDGVIGKCTKRDMGVPLEKGARSYFYVKNVDVRIEDNPVSCVFHLTRTAKALPVKLLETSIGNPDVKLHCFKRIVGQVSFIRSSGYIRRKHIERVSEQLREQIVIRKVG